MPTFTYTAKDRTGANASGTIEAETNSVAVSLLREQGLWVTDIKAGAVRQVPASGPPVERSTAKSMFSPVSLKDLSIFYRQLYTLLNAGSGLYNALEMLSNTSQCPNQALRKVVAQISQEVMAGRSLSQSMARYPWLFDKLQLRMIEAGEHGGLLVQIFERLSDYLQSQYELQLEIKRRTLYPKLLLLAFFFIPTVPTIFIAGTGAWLKELLGIVITFGLPILVLWIGIKFVLTTRGGRDGFDRVKLAIPVVGNLVRKLTVARFARTLAALYGAGVAINTATSLAGETCGNYVLETATQRVVPAIERGMPASEALATTRFFPQMFIGMVQTGETTGSLDEILNKAAEFYEEEAKHAIIQLTVILGVALLLIMAILIAIKIIGFYTGYFNNVFQQGSGGGE
jgi:type IV pilus assembly protein PilC